MTDDLEKRVRDLEVQIGRMEVALDERLVAVKLQAGEYERRLDQLNHAHEAAIEVQHTYVTQDKYEDKLSSEQEARTHALARIDEKFEEYVQRWELRQREMDQTIATLSKAAAEARQIAENQGRQTREEAERAARDQKEAAEAAQRKTTKNIAIVGIVLAGLVGIANLLPNLIS